jgi:centrosomal protein CEP19
MEQDFKKNVLKPGDKGFEYDKRVDFSSKISSKKVDNSWDEDNNNDEE